MLVSDIMSTDPVTIDVDTTLSEASRIMRDEDVHFLPVIHEDVIAGMLTAKRIGSLVATGRDPETTYAGEVMTRGIGLAEPHDLGANEGVAAIAWDATPEDAAARMDELGLRRLAVHNVNFEMVGIISRSDIEARAHSEVEHIPVM